MKSFDECLKDYASVVLHCLQIKKGDKILIDAPIDNADFVTLLTQCAYDKEVSDVAVNWQCEELDVLDMLHKDQSFSSALEIAQADYYKDYVRIRFESIKPEVYTDVPGSLIQERAVRLRSLRNKAAASLKTRVPGTIIAVPTHSWAKMVHPDLNDEEALNMLWDEVFTCVRVKEEDPLKAWDEYVANTRKRRALLNEKAYEEFHYKSAQTDLWVKPIENAQYNGGCVDNEDGSYFIPNIPTEEIFTCPNKYSVNGTVVSTRPLNFNGKIIDHFSLTLKDGKVVEYHAEKGEDVLKVILETDEGSSYFGEIAFIDKNSPISSLHTTFYTTLYDENASCHIALGLGLAGMGMSETEKEKAGINVSSLHVDFMVGSDDLCIDGKLKDGTWEAVMIDGSWSDQF